MTDHKTMSNAELLAKLAELEAENAKLKASVAGGNLTLKVSKKGALSIYGLMRNPVTLYIPAWARIFAASKDIQAFIEKHKAEFSTGKDDPRFPKDGDAAAKSADDEGEVEESPLSSDTTPRLAPNRN